jgi:L-alanine-DL-glutamate epimerase-like enolase superfamily enzyme
MDKSFLVLFFKKERASFLSGSKMKITAIETIQVREYPNLLWVQVETDAGLTGLGETFRGADAVAGQIHGLTAPYLLGRDPLQIERHSHALVNGMLGFASTGAELRAASAIDIALWDILGQASGLPLYQLLGGLSRESVRVYNTCAGYTYNNRAARKREIASGDAARPEGPYDDQVAFVHAADELAHSLLEEGYGAMKIWPFDVFAEASGGLFISAADLALGLEPFEKIRRAVGDRIEIMCEFHSMWNLPTAKRIAHALEPLRPFWSEDPIRMNNVAALRDYAAATTIPVCASETMGPMSAFRDLLEAQATSVVMLDLGWCGGLSEARKIAALAAAYQRPIAPHDCTGPVVLAASLHLSLHAPNTLYQEVVRAFLSGYYRELVTELPVVKAGQAYPMTGAGLGTKLQPSVRLREDAIIRRSAL